MEDKGYIYLMRPLISPGAMFLVLYPLVVGLLYLIRKFPPLELKVLIGVYLVVAVGILLIWIYAKSKRVFILEDQIVFQTILGKKVIEAPEIRRVVFSWTPKGQEVAVIRTHSNSYYLSELYFPFPELMADLEDFVRFNGIRCNVSGKGHG